MELVKFFGCYLLLFASVLLLLDRFESIGHFVAFGVGVSVMLICVALLSAKIEKQVIYERWEKISAEEEPPVGGPYR